MPFALPTPSKEQEDIIYKFNDSIIEVYKEYNITSLAGLDNDYVLKGRSIISWYFEIVKAARAEYKDFDFQAWLDDIVFCSDELLHFTALLYLYRPYMNNPLKDGTKLGEKIVYANRRNMPAKRFSMFANSTHEKLYNFWDRIGDVLATYFPNQIKSKNVYFAPTIDAIPAEFHNSENYKWLKEFRDTEFKSFNETRIRIVHYFTMETMFRKSHLDNSTDKEKLSQVLQQRDELPDYFNKQIQTSLIGFEKTILFLEEISIARSKNE